MGAGRGTGFWTGCALAALFLAVAAPGAAAQETDARETSAPEPDAQEAAMPPSVELPPALDRVLRDYERAWSGSDPAALAELFTEDGFILPPGKVPVRGPEAVRRAYAGAGGPLRLRALAWAASDTVGYIVGAYTYRPDGRDTGKFLLALRRSPEGPWRIAADMDNPIRREDP